MLGQRLYPEGRLDNHAERAQCPNVEPVGVVAAERFADQIVALHETSVAQGHAQAQRPPAGAAVAQAEQPDGTAGEQPTDAGPLGQRRVPWQPLAVGRQRRLDAGEGDPSLNRDLHRGGIIGADPVKLRGCQRHIVRARRGTEMLARTAAPRHHGQLTGYGVAQRLGQRFRCGGGHDFGGITAVQGVNAHALNMFPNRPLQRDRLAYPVTATRCGFARDHPAAAHFVLTRRFRSAAGLRKASTSSAPRG